jgi:hypothetical protein
MFRAETCDGQRVLQIQLRMLRRGLNDTVSRRRVVVVGIAIRSVGMKGR